MDSEIILLRKKIFPVQTNRRQTRNNKFDIDFDKAVFNLFLTDCW